MFTLGDKSLICSKHLNNSALNEFILKGKIGKCDYCDSIETIVVPFDDLMEVIVEGINNHYGSPDEENVPYNHEFGYWYKTIDTIDLIRWNLELESKPDAIIEKIIRAIGFDHDWCKRSPGYPSQSELLVYDWKLFSRLLRHKVRYVFFKYPKEFKDEYRTIDPSSILEKIGKAIVGLNLFHKTGKANLTMYRARQHKRNDVVKKCNDIGPQSPAKSNSANRFSPPGIPMFYGAAKRSTAIREVIDGDKKSQTISTGIFQNIKPLNLVDLTIIPDINVFDLKRADYYEAAIFLKHFAKAVSKKVKKTSQAFEYVPTQVITEYIRHVLPLLLQTKIDGILYKSAVHKNQICYVIFADNANCKDEGKEKKRTMLVLKENSIEKLRLEILKIETALSFVLNPNLKD